MCARIQISQCACAGFYRKLYEASKRVLEAKSVLVATMKCVVRHVVLVCRTTHPQFALARLMTDWIELDEWSCPANARVLGVAQQ